MENMSKRLPMLLLAMVLIGGTGYAIAQLLVQTNLPGTVTIVADPGLTVYDTGGVALSSLDFGEIPIGVWRNHTVIVKNTGDIALNFTCDRIDDNLIDVYQNFVFPNGTWLDPRTPKLLHPNDEITVVIEMMGTKPGTWDLIFAFYGEG